MTQRDLILTIATTTAQTPESLCVAAWQADPTKFGMKGYPEYPNYNAFIVAIVKLKLVQTGHLVRTADGMLRLPTAEEKLLASLSEPLRTAATSEAYRLFHGGRKAELHSSHARAFFGDPEDMKAAVEDFRRQLGSRETEGVKLVGCVYDWLDSSGILPRLLGAESRTANVAPVESRAALGRMLRRTA